MQSSSRQARRYDDEQHIVTFFPSISSSILQLLLLSIFLLPFNISALTFNNSPRQKVSQLSSKVYGTTTIPILNNLLSNKRKRRSLQYRSIPFEKQQGSLTIPDNRRRQKRMIIPGYTSANTKENNASANNTKLKNSAESRSQDADNNKGRFLQNILDKPFLTLLGSSTSSVVAVTFFFVLAYRRDSYMLTFFIGSIFNAVTSKILKRVLNQDRPDALQEEDGEQTKAQVSKANDKGMPSSHAMSLGFIGMYTSVGIWNALVSANSAVGSGIGSLILMASGVYGLLWTYVAVSLVYRVRSRLHTVKQVWVGLIFGIFDALLWNSLAHGTNPLIPSLNMMDAVSSYLLPEGSGAVLQCVVVPGIVGVMVVGSFERRILGWWRKMKRN